MTENEKLRQQITEIKRRYAAQPKGWMQRFAMLMGYIAVMLDIPVLLTVIEKQQSENRELRAMLNAAVRDMEQIVADGSGDLSCMEGECEFAWRGLCEENQQCRVCGCTQDNACPGGCSWVDYDLCSGCAGNAEGGA